MQVIGVGIEANLGGDVDLESLANAGDAIMQALIDIGATDPFVSIDVERATLTVEVTVVTDVPTEALAQGTALVDAALQKAGLEKRSVNDPTAHLLPA